MTERRYPAPHSLTAKLLLATVLSLLAAGAVYLTVIWMGTAVVNRYYMSADAVAERKAEIYSELNRFVMAGNVAGNDADALQRFLMEKTFVSVTVYSPKELGLAAEPAPLQVYRDAGEAGGTLYAAVRPAGQTLVLADRDEVNGKLYPMRFADGLYYISITDSSRTREDMLNRGMAGMLAFLVMITLLFWYTNRLTRRIIRLWLWVQQDSVRNTPQIQGVSATRKKNPLRSARASFLPRCMRTTRRTPVIAARWTWRSL